MTAHAHTCGHTCMTNTCLKLNMTVWWVSLVGIHVDHTVWLMSTRALLFWAGSLCPHKCWYVWQFVIVESQLSFACCAGKRSHNSSRECANAKQHEVNIRLQFINCYREHSALWKVKEVKVSPTAIWVSLSREMSFLHTQHYWLILLRICMTVQRVFIHMVVMQAY